MPVYEYRCSKCETAFDKIMSMNEDHSPEKAICPKCKSAENVKQVFGKVPIKFNIRGVQKRYLK